LASNIEANDTAGITSNVTAAETGRSFLADTIGVTNATAAGVTNATITDLLATNQLDEAIEKLDELQSRTDSSLGGSSGDDIINMPTAQQDIFIKIENLKGVLRKQLPEPIPLSNRNITNSSNINSSNNNNMTS
jgi:hypothetical protein